VDNICVTIGLQFFPNTSVVGAGGLLTLEDIVASSGASGSQSVNALQVVVLNGQDDLGILRIFLAATTTDLVLLVALGTASSGLFGNYLAVIMA
jgi:hypothetical protein